MKAVTTSFNNALFLLLAILTINSATAQEQGKKEKAADMEALLSSRNFTFKAQSARALNGGFIQLTSPYDVKVSGDTVQSYLPYFGRAYSVSLPGESGIQFTSTDFGYSLEKKKKRWDLLIRPQDTRDVRQLIFSVANNGQATLQVISNNRQAIFYNGTISRK